MSALRGHAKGLGLLSGVAGSEDVLEQGIQAVFDIIPRPMNLHECMASASSMIELDASRITQTPHLP